MRILDRQRYWAFLKAYVICFVALVGLYVVIDAFENLDEFMKVTVGTVELMRYMGRYYAIKMCGFFDRLCGVITMMAAIFTVTWMQKNNELIAMLAAGISTPRIIRPVLISSVLVSGLAIANQELLIPRIAEDLMKRPDDDGQRLMGVTSREDAHGILIHGKDGRRAARTIVAFNATLPHTLFGSIGEIDAVQARYIPEDDTTSPLRGGWLLRSARLKTPEIPVIDLGQPGAERAILVRIPPEVEARFPPPITMSHDEQMRYLLSRKPIPGVVDQTYFLRTNVGFAAITRIPQWYQFASTPDLLRALADPVTGRSEKAEIAVFLHARNLRPLMAMALLCMSLPLVLSGENRNMFVNLGLSLGTSALFYFVSFICQYLGTTQIIQPETSAWVPLIGFGTLAVARWDRIRT
ncbi:MAG: LptF/LptG family permease [Isosphaeraceae bacterium]|nr:LptF/LptG family permease [Isosphaeraceae bacterium]